MSGPLLEDEALAGNSSDTVLVFSKPRPGEAENIHVNALPLPPAGWKELEPPPSATLAPQDPCIALLRGMIK